MKLVTEAAMMPPTSKQVDCPCQWDIPSSFRGFADSDLQRRDQKTLKLQAQPKVFRSAGLQ